ncbi:MAG: tRNA (N6-isopentenyl adenosine(37)-C2)-methylthiotransferase MiaB, partial [Ignavibacteriaceae bacterium]
MNKKDMGKNKVYIETYGCQMNLADTEIVFGILKNSGYAITKEANHADVILLNTCSIRENAEQRIYGRLGNFKNLKESKPNLVVGILGCMAERLRSDLVEKKKIVDVVVGPDEYRKLPSLINTAFNGEKGIGVTLSRTETYDDIIPYREDGLQAWISVMRGCDKFCTF